MVIRDYETGLISKIIRIEISGDVLAWDIWVVDDEGEYYQYFELDIIKQNKKVKKYIKQIEKQINKLRKKRLYYMFNYIIKLDHI